MVVFKIIMSTLITYYITINKFKINKVCNIDFRIVLTEKITTNNYYYYLLEV